MRLAQLQQLVLLSGDLQTHNCITFDQLRRVQNDVMDVMQGRRQHGSVMLEHQALATELAAGRRQHRRGGMNIATVMSPVELQVRAALHTAVPCVDGAPLRCERSCGLCFRGAW